MTDSMTRRDLMRVAGTVAAAWTVQGGESFSATPRAKIESLGVISQRPEYYHGWPTVARCRSGELLVVCSGGREQHVCPFGWVELMRSEDEGRTWSWPRVLSDGPIDDRDAGILETNRGTLLATTFTSIAYETGLQKGEKTPAGQPEAWSRERLARWQAAHGRATQAERESLLGGWMIRSTDAGLTWSAPYRCLVNSPHGPIQLADGRLLYAGKQFGYGEGRIGVCESSDDGQNWRWLAGIPTRQGDAHADYHELHAVEAADGSIIAQIRNANKNNKGETLQSESSDGGRTWTTPHSIGVWGLPSHLLLLQNKNLLMTYGYRRKPYGNKARLSRDHGRSWSDPVTLSDDGAGGDLGYPSTVQLKDGSLLSVWYERFADSPRAVLRQARWTL
jgi:sialidase-1